MKKEQLAKLLNYAIIGLCISAFVASYITWSKIDTIIEGVDENWQEYIKENCLNTDIQEPVMPNIIIMPEEQNADQSNRNST